MPDCIPASFTGDGLFATTKQKQKIVQMLLSEVIVKGQALCNFFFNQRKLT